MGKMVGKRPLETTTESHTLFIQFNFTASDSRSIVLLSLHGRSLVAHWVIIEAWVRPRGPGGSESHYLHEILISRTASNAIMVVPRPPSQQRQYPRKSYPLDHPHVRTRNAAPTLSNPLPVTTIMRQGAT